MPAQMPKIGLLVPPGVNFGAEHSNDVASLAPPVFEARRKNGKDSAPKKHAKDQHRCRGPHVQLNVAICTAADGGAEKLLQLVQARRADMNLVNFSTALHRLAKLAEDGKTGTTAFDCDPRFETLLAGARNALFSKEKEGKARCLSTVAWSSARLGVCNPEMMQEIADLALQRIGEFKPYELGILLWSFAKLQISQMPLFHAASEYIRKNLDDFGAPCLATVVWSFATAQVHSSSSLIRRASDAFALRLKPCDPSKQREVVKPVALENMMWGLATMQVHPKRQSILAIAEATLEALDDFKVHEMTITLWAFARLGSHHDRLFAAAAKLVQRSSAVRSKMHAQGIANLLWAFAKCAEKDDSDQFSVAVNALLPTCLKLLPSLKPQELGCMLCSLSKLGKPWGEDASMDRIFSSAASTSFENNFVAGCSFQAIVNTLGAYSRFMRGQQGSLEPVLMLMTKLLCACPRFEAKFDAQSLLTILEALPEDLPPSPAVEVALANMAFAVVRMLNTFPQPWLHRVVSLSNRFPGEAWRLMVEQAQKAIKPSEENKENFARTAYPEIEPEKPTEVSAESTLDLTSGYPVHVKFAELTDTMMCYIGRMEGLRGVSAEEPALINLPGAQQFDNFCFKHLFKSSGGSEKSHASTISTRTGGTSRASEMGERSD
jgi:hypothetical protein